MKTEAHRINKAPPSFPFEKQFLENPTRIPIKRIHPHEFRTQCSHIQVQIKTQTLFLLLFSSSSTLNIKSHSNSSPGNIRQRITKSEIHARHRNCIRRSSHHPNPSEYTSPEADSRLDSHALYELSIRQKRKMVKFSQFTETTRDTVYKFSDKKPCIQPTTLELELAAHRFSALTSAPRRPAASSASMSAFTGKPAVSTAPILAVGASETAARAPPRRGATELEDWIPVVPRRTAAVHMVLP